MGFLGGLGGFGKIGGKFDCKLRLIRGGICRRQLGNGKKVGRDRLDRALMRLWLGLFDL